MIPLFQVVFGRGLGGGEITHLRGMSTHSREATMCQNCFASFLKRGLL